MANSVVQTIKDAEIDARSLSEFISKDASFMVTRRLAPTVHTLDYYLDRLNSLDGDFSSSVSVALSSLNSSVAEAEGKVAYIETTVQDAINSTAVEGGVLADTFVTVENKLNQRQLNRGLSSVADMLAIVEPTTGLKVTVNSYHTGKNIGGGEFVYDASLASVNDGGNVIDGWVRQGSRDYLNVRNFGGIGNGTDNPHDDLAFKRIAAYIKSSDSKRHVVHIPHGEYLVGKQEFVEGVGYTNSITFDVTYSTMQDKTIVMRADNAKLKLRDGLSYGVFDKVTNERFDAPMPFHPNTASWQEHGSKVTVAYLYYMIRIRTIKGFMLEGRLELDGNSENIKLGGKYGNVGWQIEGGGISLRAIENMSASNIISHDHAQDGIYIAGYNTRDSKANFVNLHSYRNARQGMSLTGGINIQFDDCSFYDTGTPELRWVSSPGGAVDIEAERSPIRDVTFNSCFFGRAAGHSMIADTGDIIGITFNDCTFINDIGSTVWANKPAITLNRCYINGYIERIYNASSDKFRVVFNDCTLTDDPSRNSGYTGRQHILSLLGNPIFNNLKVNSYMSGGIYSNNAEAVYNNLVYTLYGEPVSWGFSLFNASITARLRDLRPAGSTKLTATLNRSFGKVVRELVDGKSNNLSTYGLSSSTVSSAIPDSLVYMPTIPKAAAVENATATDDTAVKLNALIASLKSAGLMS